MKAFQKARSAECSSLTAPLSTVKDMTLYLGMHLMESLFACKNGSLLDFTTKDVNFSAMWLTRDQLGMAFLINWD